MIATAAHVITGFPGAGKTALLRALLDQRPHGEHWALLLNGASSIDRAKGVTVHQLGNDCACCTGRVGFRTALVQLLRGARAHRLWIELAGAGDPAAIKQVLHEASFAGVVKLISTICVVQPRHLANADIAGHEIFAAQLKHADYFVLAEDDALALNVLTPRGKSMMLLQDATLGALSAPVTTAYSNDSSRRISS